MFLPEDLWVRYSDSWALNPDWLPHLGIGLACFAAFFAASAVVEKVLSRSAP